MIFVSEFLVIVTHSVGHFQQSALGLVTDLFDGDCALLVGDDGVGVRIVADTKAEDFACVIGNNF